MFSLPHGPDASPSVISKGTVDTNPIHLPNTIKRIDFDNLLIYLYKGPSVHPKTNEFLVSILALFTLFGIKDGISHAVSEFTRVGNCFHPALQFQLARCYRVDSWIEPAFCKLINLPIDSLTIEHVDQIGTFGFYHLVQTKQKLLTVRRELAFHIPPATNHQDCQTPAYCIHAWSREWTESVPRIIHHPEVPSDSAALLLALDASDIDGLCKPCKDLSVSWMWGEKWVSGEEELIAEGVAALMALQMGSPLRARLNGSTVEAASYGADGEAYCTISTNCSNNA
ncbi:hypothetical protein C8J57DRAFT_1508491 [Mycena rebaudengoi]|nr:hypothetical protein C8J57DRAFT_1508491 [Mycena rebaudengoi]